MHLANAIANRAGDALAAKDLDTRTGGPVIDLPRAAAAGADIVDARPRQNCLSWLSAGGGSAHGHTLGDQEQSENPAKGVMWRVRGLNTTHTAAVGFYASVSARRPSDPSGALVTQIPGAARPRRRSFPAHAQGVRRNDHYAVAQPRMPATADAALHPTVQLRADVRGGRGDAAHDRRATIARSPVRYL